MHTFSETGTAVPAFLAKLWRLVDDPETNDLICWSKDGRSFIIQNQAVFAHDLLPLNYKHNNMASFIRQLNMYGFHKITSIDNGGLKFDRDEMEFTHPFFKRGSANLLAHIKRKISNSTKAIDEKASSKNEAVSKVLQDVKSIRGRQESLDTQFITIKQENQALWREVASLRQKHAKQQQILNKLIHFLISIVQPARNMTGVKRQMQLMINDNPQNTCDLSESESECGPIIHELSEELLDEVAGHTSSKLIRQPPESPERPQSSMSAMSNNQSNQSVEDVLLNARGTSKQPLESNRSAIVTTPVSPIFQQTGKHQMQDIEYDVMENPDSQAATDAINEDNILETPMARKQTARTQLLKQRNKQRRKPLSQTSSKQMRTTQTSQKSLLLSQQQRQKQQQQQQQQVMQGQQTVEKQQQQVTLSMPQLNDSSEFTIKRENQGATDPMYFLDFDNGEADMMGALDDDNVLASDNFNANNMLQNSPNINISLPSTPTTALTPTSSLMSMPSPGAYSPSTFISDDINQDLFEQTNFLPTNNEQLNKKNNNNKNDTLTEQQQFDSNFSSFWDGGNKNDANNDNDPPTGGDKSDSMSNENNLLFSTLVSQGFAQTDNNQDTSQQQQNIRNEQNMAVAKYSKNQQQVASGSSLNKNLMLVRDEVNGQLESVQDDLESLKELLRGNGYSLDASLQANGGSLQTPNADVTVASLDYLTKLFDSDISNPYGISTLPPLDAQSNRTGSELATYQPIYDFLDIMEPEKNAENKDETTASTSDALRNRRMTLNTPCHD